jgi:hypothetical protein
MLTRWLSRWYTPTKQYAYLQDELQDTIKAYDNLSRNYAVLQQEFNKLERQALELFKNRLDQRRKMFPSSSQEQLSVMRTAYPRLGDLYIKQYEELD